MAINNDYRSFGWHTQSVAIQPTQESLSKRTVRQESATEKTPIQPVAKNTASDSNIVSNLRPLPLISFDYGTSSRHGSLAIQAYIEQQHSIFVEDRGASERKTSIDIIV